MTDIDYLILSEQHRRECNVCRNPEQKTCGWKTVLDLLKEERLKNLAHSDMRAGVEQIIALAETILSGHDEEGIDDERGALDRGRGSEGVRASVPRHVDGGDSRGERAEPGGSGEAPPALRVEGAGGGNVLISKTSLPLPQPITVVTYDEELGEGWITHGWSEKSSWLPAAPGDPLSQEWPEWTRIDYDGPGPSLSEYLEAAERLGSDNLWWSLEVETTKDLFEQVLKENEDLKRFLRAKPVAIVDPATPTPIFDSVRRDENEEAERQAGTRRLMEAMSRVRPAGRM